MAQRKELAGSVAGLSCLDSNHLLIRQLTQFVLKQGGSRSRDHFYQPALEDYYHAGYSPQLSTNHIRKQPVMNGQGGIGRGEGEERQCCRELLWRLSEFRPQMRRHRHLLVRQLT